MQLELLLQIAIIALWTQRSPESSDPLTEAGHLYAALALAGVVQQRLHDGRHAIPLRLLGGKLPTSGGGDVIETRLPVGISHAPCGTYETALFQPHQARVKRPHVDLKGTGGHLLQTRGDRVAVE